MAHSRPNGKGDGSNATKIGQSRPEWHACFGKPRLAITKGRGGMLLTRRRHSNSCGVRCLSGLQHRREQTIEVQLNLLYDRVFSMPRKPQGQAHALVHRRCLGVGKKPALPKDIGEAYNPVDGRDVCCLVSLNESLIGSGDVCHPGTLDHQVSSDKRSIARRLRTIGYTCGGVSRPWRINADFLRADRSVSASSLST